MENYKIISQKSEVRSQKSEVRSQKSEVRSQKYDSVLNNKCQVRFIGSLTNHGPNFAGACFLITGSSPTITTCQGGGRQPHIIVNVRN